MAVGHQVLAAGDVAGPGDVEGADERDGGEGDGIGRQDKAAGVVWIPAGRLSWWTPRAVTTAARIW